MEKGYTLNLPCGTSITVDRLRTTTDYEHETRLLLKNWLPFVSLVVTTFDFFDVETENGALVEAYQIGIPIQLRSLQPLIDFLSEVKKELEK